MPRIATPSETRAHLLILSLILGIFPILQPSPVQADCKVRGSAHSGYFMVCHEKESQRHNLKNGKDVILISGGEVISITVEKSGAGELSAEAAGIDTGNGKDTVQNNRDRSR